MALVLQDRVKETSSSTGTTAFTLGGAFVGYRTFNSCIPTGSVVYYCIHGTSTGIDSEWEVGYGTFTAPATLSRTAVFSSSNSDALVSFSAGDKEVFITYPAEKGIYEEVNGETLIDGGPITVVGSGVTAIPNLPAELGKFVGNVDSFGQIYNVNQNDGTSASADFVAYNNQTTDGFNYFVDMGINSENYSSVDYPLFTPSSAYLFNDGGTLYIGSQSSDVVLFAGGVTSGDVVATANATTKNVAFSNNVSLTGNVSANNANFTTAAYASSNVALITSPNQLVTKQYVDQVSSAGLHIHEPVLVETTGNLTAAYAQGGTTFNITDITTANTVTTSATHSLALNDQIWLTSTAGNGLSANVAYFVYSIPAANQLTLSLTFGGSQITTLTNAAGLTYPVRANSGVGATLTNSGTQVALEIDGVTMASTNRVMVRLQTNPEQNGVYTVTDIGSGSTNWVLTRATDANKIDPGSPLGLGTGDYFFTLDGDINAGDSHVLTTEPNTMIIGYTGLTYELFSASPTYTGTAPINVSGQTISLTGTVGATNGGTGANTVATGDILYGSATNTWSKLPVGAAYKALVVNASGTQVEWNAVALNQSGAVSGSLPATNGGTGQSTYTLGDIVYSNATNTLAKLAGQTTTTQKFLSQTGDGVNSAAPVWDTIPAGSITGLGTMSTQNANAVTITGGFIDNTAIGGFTPTTGTFTTATATLFAGSGANLTNLNGSNVSSGTVANARTTATNLNTASAIVARDASGNFAAGTITANLTGTASSATSATSATTATNIAGGAAGGIPYQTGSGATSILATGTGVLVGGTTPAYSTSPALTGTNFTGIPNAGLSNSSVTFNGVAVALGSSGSINTNSAVTFNSGGTGDVSGTTFNGSAARTISYNTIGAYAATNPNGYTTNTGTVTSVSGTGTVSGLTLSGTVTTSGNLTLGGTLSAVTSAVAGTGVSVSGATGAVTFSIGQAVATGSNVQFNSLGVGTAGSGTAGEIRATNNITAYYSDERLKTKIGNIENALDKVKQIETMVYHANETAVELGYDASIIEVGVTAQSVQRVMPQTVAPAPIDDKYLTVRYERLVPLLIEAIKELEAQVAELKAK